MFLWVPMMLWVVNRKCNVDPVSTCRLVRVEQKNLCGLSGLSGGAASRRARWEFEFLYGGTTNVEERGVRRRRCWEEGKGQRSPTHDWQICPPMKRQCESNPAADLKTFSMNEKVKNERLFPSEEELVFRGRLCVSAQNQKQTVGS